ncbi:hypothetical protein [Catellicoccus marimammalium]|uniref:Uncharacterized protein n=1 Tax=Catellicoccus marimammalium M35/04/3 TaxID=1234409 RepID=K8ZBJ6_9ENTE|nr:hypothetical protein [Catellicoccus marimammalium]EKU27422.1 hypothetical protein C683_0753 [Catellicoccus marimammalium M35/04/3]
MLSTRRKETKLPEGIELPLEGEIVVEDYHLSSKNAGYTMNTEIFSCHKQEEDGLVKEKEKNKK